MKNKGQATSLSQMLVGLAVIGLVGLLIFFFITRGQEIDVRVEENEVLRRRVILTNVLLSSDLLVYSNDGVIHRGILDAKKIDKLTTVSLTKITYPQTGYSLKVVDLDNNNKWIIGKNFGKTYESPVAIRYSKDEIHIGLLSIAFNREHSDGGVVIDPVTDTTLPPSTTTFHWPSSWAEHCITSPFGWRDLDSDDKKDDPHDGVDIRAQTEGTEIYSAIAGEIINTGFSDTFGNYIVISSEISGETYTIKYAHLSEISKEIGSNVNAGDTIGFVGSAGCIEPCTGIHLHFEIRDSSNKAHDPCNFLSSCSAC